MVDTADMLEAAEKTHNDTIIANIKCINSKGFFCIPPDSAVPIFGSVLTWILLIVIATCLQEKEALLREMVQERLG